MLLQVTTVYDKATESHGRPMYTTTIGHAIRIFKDEVNNIDQQNLIYKHPEDFSLWHLGTWDDHKAEFHLNKIPVHLKDAATLRELSNAQEQISRRP